MCCLNGKYSLSTILTICSFFQKVCKDSFLSCIQSSFVSFLKLQKILNYTPHCGQCFDGHKKKPLGNCLWEEGARVGGEGGGQAFWSAVSQNPQISQNHLLSASNAGPGFRLIPTQVIGSPFKFLVRHPRPRPRRASNDNPIDDDSSKTTRSTKSNKIASLFQFLISC